jgi:hypothetical protein
MACQTDSQCGPGLACVAQVIDGIDLGSYCFPLRTNGCADENYVNRPFSRPLDALSVDDSPGTYCLPQASCRAVVDATQQRRCSVMGPADADICGDPKLRDGICSASGSCTYRCQANSDCPSLGPASCRMPEGYCE